jgi:hypothetical protein
MNANRALRFRQNFHRTRKTRRRLSSYLLHSVGGGRHGISSMRQSGAAFALAAATIVASLLSIEAAFAAQGPGTGAGTASSLTQLAMAVIVYGMSALVVVAGLIGAARGRQAVLPASNQKYRKQPHAK